MKQNNSNKSIELIFRDIFNVLVSGSPYEYKQAKTQLEGMWHNNNKSFLNNAPVVFEYMKKFASIKKPENQAAFCSGLSLFYLALADEYFEKLKDFTLLAIQHPDGRVRNAILKTSAWLRYSLDSRIRPFQIGRTKQKDTDEMIQSKAINQYKLYVTEIEALIDKYDNHDDSVYINDMKSSVEKSLQYLLVEVTEIANLIPKSELVDSDIILKRKQINDKLKYLLNSVRSKSNVKYIIDNIYSEQGNSDLPQLIAIFDTGYNTEDLQNIIDTVVEAWNYFPHKTLDGKCPAELIYNRDSC
jgi:hypothetical protein